MLLQHLVLRHFRSYEHAEISFSPSVNLIHGKNGHGKTNLLEAIYLISTGRSFRTRRLQDLIRFGASHFYLEAHFTKNAIPQTLKIYCDPTTRRVHYNETTSTHFSSLLGILPHILLAPDDHDLINGSPATRRRFIDLHMAQLDPLYLHHLGRYFKAMKHRNHLLRSQQLSSISAWEQIMAPAAAYLVTKRKEALTHLAPHLTQWMHIFSGGKEKLHTTYLTQPLLDPTDSHQFLNQWTENRSKESRLGSTLYGPHRDDMAIHIAGQEAKSFASEGQKRCAATAFRFAEWERFHQHLGQTPLLSIDDFGIQLDAERIPLLHKQLFQFGQVFLTTPHPITAHASTQFIHVEDGRLHLT